MQKHVKLYSAEKNYETGNGYFSVAFPGNDPDLADKIRDAKIKQQEANAEFKRKKVAGLVGPPKPKPEVHPGYNGEVGAPKSYPDPTPIRIPVQPPEQLRTPFKLLLDSYTGNTTFVIGSSKMGKSTALMRIYDQYYAPKEFVSILWTANPQIQLYKSHKKLIVAAKWDKYGEDIIKSQKKIQTKTGNKYKFLNIFDDVINVRNNTLLDNLILTYRNSKMSSIISLQYSNLMSKCSRANCNNVLAFGFNTDESIEVVIKTFLTGYLKKIGIKSIPDQVNWYKEVTKDHGFIYIKPADGIVSFHKF